MSLPEPLNRLGQWLLLSFVGLVLIELSIQAILGQISARLVFGELASAVSLAGVGAALWWGQPEFKRGNFLIFAIFFLIFGAGIIFPAMRIAHPPSSLIDVTIDDMSPQLAIVPSQNGTYELKIMPLNANASEDRFSLYVEAFLARGPREGLISSKPTYALRLLKGEHVVISLAKFGTRYRLMLLGYATPRLMVYILAALAIVLAAFVESRLPNRRTRGLLFMSTMAPAICVCALPSQTEITTLEAFGLAALALFVSVFGTTLVVLIAKLR